MDESKKDDLSKVSQNEHLYKITRFLGKSSIGVIASGGLSSIALELFDLIVGDPAIKRRDKFLVDLSLRIEKTENISLENLLNNEEAAALLIRAVQSAMRSSGDKKLDALKEAALKGIISSNARKTSPAQIVIGLLDRMTEHHVILITWKRNPETFYPAGQFLVNEKARRSKFYGQPVFTDISILENPQLIFSFSDLKLYVEKDNYVSFELAHSELINMGLLEPILKKEKYLEGRVAKQRITPEISGYKISKLGEFFCDFIEKNAEYA